MGPSVRAALFGTITLMVRHAVRNKLLPLLITYCMYIVIEGVIVVGILLYS